MEENWTLCAPRPSSGLDPKATVIAVTPRPSEADLAENQVIIKVDRFGFSANNVTYQALGEHPHFRYFDFHSAPETKEVSSKLWGVVPVWGFGEIVGSKHPKIHVGERVYGYLAPARFLIVPVSPSDVNRYAFYVPRPHLPQDRRPYNMLLRCATDPQYTPTRVGEDLTMLFRPLFWTSYWCEDWLNTTQYRGASTILISSASSKTAFCLAYLVRKRKESKTPTNIIGLTSRGNLAFTKSLNLYTDVFDYESFFLEKKQGKVVYIDVAGNADLNLRIFNHFEVFRPGSSLVCAVQLGYSSLSPSSTQGSSLEWNDQTRRDSASSLATQVESPTLEQFFMVEWLDIRRKQLPIDQIFTMQTIAWREFMKNCSGWIKLEHVEGRDLINAYDRISNGKLGAETAYIWSLFTSEKSKL